jgi:surfeit locus 1 family protein
MTGSARQRGLLTPIIVTSIAFVILIALGQWQVQRMAWKEGLLDTLNARLAAPPIALPPQNAWPSLSQDEFEYRRVSFTAEILAERSALIYTHGSSLRPDVDEVGFWIFAPARLADGSQVVVNRGFVPERQRAAGVVPATPVTITGVARWPEARGLFIPDGDRATNTWFARDQLAIAAAKQWGEVAPFYVEQEAPPNAGGLPRVGRLVPVLPNSHLQYALTWFGLALVLVVVFGFWVRSQRQTAETTSS